MGDLEVTSHNDGDRDFERLALLECGRFRPSDADYTGLDVL